MRLPAVHGGEIVDTRRRVPLALVRRHGVSLAIAALLIVAAVAAPAFYDPTNLFNVLRLASMLGLVAIGQTLVLLVGGLDLSVGAVIGLTMLIVAESTHGRDGQLPQALALCAAAGLAAGLLNGLLVTQRRVPPFVATLGTFVLIEGARLAYTRGSVSGTLPADLRVAALGGLGPFPYAFLIWMAANALFMLLLSRSPFGRKLYATGANPEAARLAGVPVTRVVVAAYVLCSLLTVAAGLLMSGYIGYVDRYVGRGSDLDSIAAAVVGGTSFAGGRGGLGGTIAGVILVTVLLNLVLILGLNAQLQLVVKGLVVIGAVALYRVLQNDV